MTIFYCVFSERLIARNHVHHIQQFREDREGNRYPLIKNGRAKVIEKDGIYFGIINDDEVIAASDEVEVVHNRLKYADKDVKIRYYKDGRYFKTLDGYLNSFLPRIFRMSWSEAGDHGLIIAVDDYKNGNYSNTRLFYDWDDLITHIRRRQGGNRNFFLVGREPRKGFKKELRDLNEADLTSNLRRISHLQKAVKDRQKLGSHEAYIEKVKRERVLIKYGRTEDTGEDPHPNEFKIFEEEGAINRSN